MILRQLPLALLGAAALCLLAPRILLAEGGTSVVATHGEPAHIATGWPEGVGDVVNDPARTTGWNWWFSEWSSDVNQYAFEVSSTAEVNRLIEKLAAIKSELRQIRLSHLKEPGYLGGWNSVPEGNKIPVIFSIGDQSRINEWFNSVRNPFGGMEFVACPIAVPPTLTIFVQNEAVNLDELKIPDGIHVESGYVPTVFHRSNTVDEKKREEDARNGDETKRPSEEDLDSAARATLDKIEAFLKKRSSAAKP
jgi:hypothetical protein